MYKKSYKCLTTSISTWFNTFSFVVINQTKCLPATLYHIVPLNIGTIWYYLEKKWHTYCFSNVHFHRCPSTQMNGIAAERFLLRQKWRQMQLSDHLGMLSHTLSSLTWHHNQQWTVRKDKEFPVTMRARSPNLPRDAFLLHSFIILRDLLALLKVTVQMEPQK